MKKAICIFLAAVLLMTSAACGKADDPSTVAPSTTQALLFVQTGDQSTAAVSTEHFSFSKGEMVYLFAMIFNNFLYNYSSYISFMGLDPSASLKTQTYLTGDMTWFAYFMDQAKNYAVNYLTFCEAASESGMVLDEEDEKYIQEQKKALEEEAVSFGWDVNTYLGQIYMTNVTWDYVESAMRKMRLSEKYYEAHISSKSFTAEELEAEYAANTRKYALIDYYEIDFGDGENIPEEVLREVRSALEADGSFDSLRSAVRTFLSKVRTTTELEDAGGLDSYTDKYLSEKLKTGVPNADTPFFDWVYNGDTEIKTDKIFFQENEETRSFYAYLLVKMPYKNMSRAAVDVRHILFMLKSNGGKFETAEAAHAEAERVWNEWVRSGAGEEDFITLCKQYSEDGNAASGGLYTGVTPGKMVQPYNDWCFDESRKPGDHGIVDTQFGSHIMYYVGGHIEWEVSVDDALFSAFYNAFLEDQQSRTPVDVKEDVLNSVVW